MKVIFDTAYFSWRGKNGINILLTVPGEDWNTLLSAKVHFSILTLELNALLRDSQEGDTVTFSSCPRGLSDSGLNKDKQWQKLIPKTAHSLTSNHVFKSLGPSLSISDLNTWIIHGVEERACRTSSSVAGIWMRCGIGVCPKLRFPEILARI